jgi:nitrite reductase/ring-hydroxylating ferredoxin subunit
MEFGPDRFGRRGLLAAAAMSLVSLAGCGGSTTQHEPDTNSQRGGPEQGPRSPAPGQPGPGIVAKAAEIPVGGGRVFPDKQLVVTQPTVNDFRGFKAVCTYKDCKLSSVENDLITCPCHGCRFSVVDGSVRTGPATRPLTRAVITLDGDEINLLDLGTT